MPMPSRCCPWTTRRTSRSGTRRISVKSRCSSRSCAARTRPWRRRRRCCSGTLLRSSTRQKRSRPTGDRTRGGLTAPADRRKALEILDAAVYAGARARKVAEVLGCGSATLLRWRRQFAADPDFAALLPEKNVAAVADRGLSVSSERSFYRVLNDNSRSTAGGRLSLLKNRGRSQGRRPELGVLRSISRPRVRNEQPVLGIAVPHGVDAVPRSG